jgi:hypothetical protein
LSVTACSQTARLSAAGVSLKENNLHNIEGACIFGAQGAAASCHHLAVARPHTATDCSAAGVTLKENNLREIEGGRIFRSQGAAAPSHALSLPTNNTWAACCAAGVTLKENNLREIEGGRILESQGVLVANRRSLLERPAQLLPVLHELLERLDAHLKAEQFYSGGCLLQGLATRRAAVHGILLWGLACCMVVLPVLHELLERLDAHLKAEQFYSGGCIRGAFACCRLVLLAITAAGAAGRTPQGGAVLLRLVSSASCIMLLKRYHSCLNFVLLLASY